MNKIKVPGGMIEAAHKSSEFTDYEREKRALRFSPGIINTILEAALLWMTEHPIVPTPAQQLELYRAWSRSLTNNPRSPHPIEDQIFFSILEWQRRMFYGSEPEAPEEIKDLLTVPAEAECGVTWTNDGHDRAVLEAYRRGKQSQKP